MSSNRHADETSVEDDDRIEDSPAEARKHDRRSPYFPSATWGWWPSPGWRDAFEGRGAEHPSGDTKTSQARGLRRYWDEGLITLLVVGGAVLFLVPEPATSALGVLLMAIGVLAWLVDWAT